MIRGKTSRDHESKVIFRLLASFFSNSQPEARFKNGQSALFRPLPEVTTLLEIDDSLWSESGKRWTYSGILYEATPDPFLNRIVIHQSLGYIDNVAEHKLASLDYRNISRFPEFGIPHLNSHGVVVAPMY